MRSIAEELRDALLLFAFILVVVPLHLLNSAWRILRRYVLSHLSLRIVGTAAILVYVGVMVSYQLVSELPTNPGKINTLCGNAHGCGVSPTPGFAIVFVVAFVIAISIVVTDRVNSRHDG